MKKGDLGAPWADMTVSEVCPEAQPHPTTNDKQHKKDNSVMHLLASFLEGTTAHALPKVMSSQSVLRRSFWLAVFLGAFVLFVYQVTVLFKTYYQYPVAVRMQIVNRRVWFPCTYIIIHCSPNQ